MTKKLIVCIVSLCAACTLTACGASVSMYTGSTASYYTQTLEIRLPASVYNVMEKTAAVKPGTYARWKFTEWLYALSQLVSFSDGTSYEYDGYMTDPKNNDFVAQLTRKIPIDAADGSDEESETSQTVKNYFYAYAVEVTQPNPFNGLRTDYDTAAPGQNGSVTQMIKNGIGYYREDVYVEVLPSLAKAFPATAGYDPGSLKLNLYLNGSSKMVSTGTKVTIDSKTYYLWERAFDDREETITYKYYRPNSLGWNITAIVAASAVAGIILLATRGKKQKETLLERYPYDPFDSGSGSNLPSDRGGFHY